MSPLSRPTDSECDLPPLYAVGDLLRLSSMTTVGGISPEQLCTVINVYPRRGSDKHLAFNFYDVLAEGRIINVDETELGRL